MSETRSVDTEEEAARKAAELHNKETELMELKMRKSRGKAAFSRLKNRLHDLCESNEVTKSELKDSLDKVETAMDSAVEAIHEVANFYKTLAETGAMKKTMEEITEIEIQYDDLLKVYRQCMLELTSSASGGSKKSKDSEPDEPNIGKDLWKQLKRVSVPVFDGNKRNYQSWKAASDACVDQAPATAEYKLLQLRQYLQGEALRCVEDLGHSAEAYEAAKSRLDRKFGGERRQVGRFLEDLEKFSPIKSESAREIEKFADLLDLAVIKLKKFGHGEDLKNGSLYQRLLKKLSQDMLTRYNRWVFENKETESLETLRQWTIREAEFATAARETIHGLEKSKRESRKSDGTYFVQDTNKNSDSKKKCALCNQQSHSVWNCKSFADMPCTERWDKAKELKLCFRCLGHNHSGKDCRRTKTCGVNNCKKNHHKLLHREQTSDVRENNRDGSTSSGATVIVPLQEFTHVSTKSDSYRHFIGLRTVPVLVSFGGKKLKINALLDDGSTQSYVNSSVIAELGLPLSENQYSVTVNVLNGQQEVLQTKPVTIGLESLNGSVKMQICANTVENVTGNLQVLELNSLAQKWKHLKEIRFPYINRKGVDMLIGLDYSDLHQSLHEVRGHLGEPIARLTPLGWTCVGNLTGSETVPNNSFYTFFQQGAVNLDETLRRFWETESVNMCDNLLSVEDQRIIEQTEKSLKYREGRYEVGIPWKERKTELPNNYDMAYKRLENTEKHLKKNEQVAEAYQQTIDYYVDVGYVSKMESKTDKRWFLPHFPIVRPEKTTTKVRLVFDASAKFDGVSLNDAIEAGPKLQRELFDVLIRFRRKSVAVVCDVQEMYLQVGIPGSDREYHSFLWTASSETLMKSTYMDDSMDSVSNEDEAVELFHQLSKLWQKAGMYARKWLSNSSVVLEQIPKQDRAYETELSKHELPSIKTLGVLWEAKDDMFTFRYTAPDLDTNYTKRKFLSKVATIYDPLGFLSPYTVRAKILMQDIWLSGTDWNETLSDELNSEVKSWFEEMTKLEEVKVPRCINDMNSNLGEIHVFVDASEKAYGAVAYTRVLGSDHPVVRFIAAKSKVAPLTSTSIPRLELMAACLGLHLAQNICKALEKDLGLVTLWSDSMDVIWWIRGQSRKYKTFVSKRIGMIHEVTVPSQWLHVSSKENPADLVSRGLPISKIIDNDFWWSGPEFLKSSENLPQRDFVPNDEAKAELKRKSAKSDIEMYQFFTATEPKTFEDNRLAVRYSSWMRLVCVTAWVERFIDNCQLPQRERRKTGLLVEEIQSAELKIIKNVQIECFGEEYSNLMKGRELPKTSRVLPLHPKLDEEGVMRSDSRLGFHEHLSYNVRFPIILPRDCWVTKLIIRHFHEQNGHCGTNQTLSALSTKYWIISAREEIRKVESECYECKRRKVRTAQQIMAPVPPLRLGRSMQAFSETAVDFAGPFLTKQGRGKTREKRYLCVFTCMACRAVHLEMAYHLDTDSFLNTFYRFVSRRGLPKVMLSDNGTNFVGAVRELRELYRQLDKDKISPKSANQGIQWYFNLPLAPHFGGIHESMVKSAKRAIYRVMGNADVNDEELLTAFVGDDGLLNSRPLTYQSSNPADNCVLTPNHFLHGRVGGQFAETVDVTNIDIRKRWRRVQELVRHFWKRWMQEYLPTLGSRKKWQNTTRDFQIGDVVMVIDPDSSRGQWSLGRISQVFPGVDGHVRVAEIQIGNKIMKRPITRLCLLEEN